MQTALGQYDLDDFEHLELGVTLVALPSPLLPVRQDRPLLQIPAASPFSLLPRIPPLSA
jgi:hypothetical protein